MRRRLQTIALLLTLVAAGGAQAFNGQRQAFLVGLGIGYHATELEGAGSDGTSGIASSVRVGFGLDNQTVLYYVTDGSWYHSAGDTWAAGLNGLGGAWYLSPGPRSLYLHGAYGYSYQTLPRKTGNNARFGNGYTLGLGYEFRRHLSVEANYLHTNIKSGGDGRYPRRTGGWRLMLNYTLY